MKIFLTSNKLPQGPAGETPGAEQLQGAGQPPADSSPAIQLAPGVDATQAIGLFYPIAPGLAA